MARLDLVSVRKTARYQYCAILTRNALVCAILAQAVTSICAA